MELPFLIWILLFLISYAFIYYFADYLIDLIEDLSDGFSISPVILGILVLGIDLEESIVSLFAARESLPYLSIGNLIGNSIFGIVIAFAIPPLLYKIKKFDQMPKFYYISLILAIISMLLSTISPQYLLYFAIFNLLIFIFYVIGSVKIQREYHSIKDESSHGAETGIRLFAKVVMVILIIFFAGQLLVTSSVQILIMSNLSESFFGLIITALITNVEEFWLMVKSIQKGKVEIGISAQIGKLLWNSTLIFGISGVILSSFVVSSIMIISSVFLAVITAILIFNLLRNNLSKRNSKIYLFIMVLYVIINVLYF